MSKNNNAKTKKDMTKQNPFLTSLFPKEVTKYNGDKWKMWEGRIMIDEIQEILKHYELPKDNDGRAYIKLQVCNSKT